MQLNFRFGTAGLTLPEERRKKQQRTLRDYVSFVFLLSVAGLSAAQGSFEEDFDDGEKPWKEIEVQLPAAPLAGNLIPFFVSSTATQDFAIDAKSLTLGADGVIRYVLIATSTSGAKNISYEGIRCQSYEKKLYAFGRQDGTWSRSRRDKWEAIRSNAANRQHAALAQDYFCQGLTIAGTPQQMQDRLRKKQTLAQ